MQEKVLPYSRGPQILEALADYGPLATVGMREIVKPRMKKRRLHDTVERLFKRKLITKRFHPLAGFGAIPFYQLNQRPPHKERVADLLSHPLKAHQPQFRFVDLCESQHNAIWRDRFRELVPNYTVLANHEVFNDASVQNLLKIEENRFRFLPDLVLLGPVHADGRRSTVAVEIERTLENEKHLLDRIRHYIRKSEVDGVLYIGFDDTLDSRFRQFCELRKLHPAFKNATIFDVFLMFSNGLFDNGLNRPLMVNLDLKRFKLSEWLHALDVCDMRALMKSWE